MGRFGWDQVSKKTTGSAVVFLAVVLSTILTWNFWFVEAPLTSDNETESKVPFIVASHEVIFEVGSGSFLSLKLKKELTEPAEVRVILDDPDIIESIGSFKVEAGTKRTVFVPLQSKNVAGHCVMTFVSSSKELENLFQVRIKIKVVHHILFGYLSIFLGWGYFLLWGASYYPQIYQNWRRRSVVGYSFDYLFLNMTAHLCYCVFNTAMYYNDSIQRSYTKLHPKGELPVIFQDSVFSVHAVTMNVLLVIQCLLYDIGDQRVSFPMMTLVGGLWVSIMAALLAAIKSHINWLQFLYFLSYIKVGTTPIKYTPQVYLHFLRKSTEGWAIHSVILDGLGGVFCFLQMTTDALNNDDWDGTLGNPGKLGLGLIAIFYNAIFAFQHFILYRQSSTRKRMLSDREAYDSGKVLGEDFLEKLDKKVAEVKATLMPKHQHKLVHRVQDV